MKRVFDIEIAVAMTSGASSQKPWSKFPAEQLEGPIGNTSFS